MKRQRGLATLLVTTMLLVVSLIFSLASYKNLFYQIKRTQNEVMARKAHWLAEGGLECGFAVVNSSGVAAEASLLGSCESGISDKVEITANGTGFTLNSLAFLNGNAKKALSKSFSVSSKSEGAIKSTSNVILDITGGNIDIYPDPNVENGDGYDCVVARFSDNFTIKGELKNKGLSSVYPPYTGFDFIGPPVGQCNTDFMTTSVSDTSYTSEPEKFKRDFVQQENINPFEEMFGLPKEQWEEVKRDFVVIQQEGSCSSAIADKISEGNNKIWIEGACDLKGEANEINTAMNGDGAAKSALIVVQDGVVSFNGAAVSLNVILYQFLTPSEPKWEPTVTEWEATSVSAHVPDKSSYVHYQFGALHTKGGFIFDMPGYDVSITGSVNFSFNGDIYNEVTSSSGIPKWIKGSWHDF